MASGLHLARLRCTGCGECCRGLRVPLTFADLARLQAFTGALAEELVQWESPERVDIAGEPSSLVLLPEGRRVMLLRQREGACQFLDDARRCTVHAARPAACRAYPLHATLGARGGVRRLRVLRGIECPYDLAGPPALANVRRDQAELQRELVQHHQSVLAWNRGQEHRRRLGKRLAPAAELFQRCLAPSERLVSAGPTR